ncbi:MAG: hypothetical protein R2764_05715 [Bacteroidales bacterium]
MDNANFRDKLKMFNEGTLTLKDGTTKKGQVALINQQSANYKSREGIIELIGSDKIERFDVTIGLENKAIINIDNKLTEEFFKEPLFGFTIIPHQQQ